jgi:hypothetical protein
MGILSGKRNAAPSLSDVDPFDALDEAVLEKTVFAKPSAPQKRDTSRGSSAHEVASARGSRSTKKYILAGLVIGLTGFAVARTKIWDMFARQELVYAYFEVRALDAGGRPIAGAIVKNAGKRVGTTDSFGEWRRYMRVPLGATVPVTIAKKSGASELLYATKNFAVPLARPEKSEIELRGSVQLQVTDMGNAQASTAAQSSPTDMLRAPVSSDHIAKKGEATKASAKDDIASTVASDTAETRKSEEAPVTEKPTLAAGGTDKAAGGSSEHALDFRSSHESVWIESGAAAGHLISREVVPAMVQRAKELGLKVDPQAQWKVRVTNLVDRPAHVDKEGGGLILVSSQDGNQGGSHREFLRNYQMDSRLTARGILFILSHHVSKNVLVRKVGQKWVAGLPKSSADLWKLAPGMTLSQPGNIITLSDETSADGSWPGFVVRGLGSDLCANARQACEFKTRSFAESAPMPTWTRLRLKAPSLGKDQVKIFVSGYEANLVGDKVYEYWGQNRARANVTVIAGGKVLQRSQIFSDSAMIPVLGAATIGRR